MCDCKTLKGLRCKNNPVKNSKFCRDFVEYIRNAKLKFQRAKP